MKTKPFHAELLCSKPKKRLFILRFVFLLACIICLKVSAHGYAQTRVSLSFNKIPLKQAISLLEKEGKVRILYSEELLPPEKMVSLTVKDELILSVLSKLLSGTGLTYKVLEHDLVAIVPVTHATGVNQQKKLIKGRITDTDNKPLAGVSISSKGGKRTVLSDEEGNYTIQVEETDSVLVFNHVGYKPAEHAITQETVVNISLQADLSQLTDVIVVGYGTKKKETVTAAISSIGSKDLENVHAGSTVSASLAGKIPGVTFRMSDSRPGASASVQIRNMGSPLFIIDGIQQDAGQFNNIAPNDIESITVLKDASAAIYGVRAANGVVIVTTKRGKIGSRNTVDINAYTGWQNWTRFPKTVNAYEWQMGKADADMNQYGKTSITQADLDKYKAGTEPGYKNFNWYDFIIKGNAPLTQANINFSGGSDKINYYVSGTHLKQYSVLGREFTFERTNIQSNIDARIGNNFKIGAQINGRVETRDQPGVPGTDDYWEARFAILRNTPMERPYANDNPAYPNNIGHNTENWALQTKKLSGYWHQDWRVLQSNVTAEYQTPLKGLSLKGLFSYYYANQLLNGHEYTYNVYTYYPGDSSYRITGGSSNPWRERAQETILSPTIQLQANYNRSFGQHTISATFVAERIKRRDIYTWVHAVPTTNELPLIYFSTMDTYNDQDRTEARLGYVGRVSYNYADKYFIELSGRRDAAYEFPPNHRWGNFPSISGGWRITKEKFFSSWVNPKILTDLKFRASYGQLGDDSNWPISNYAYLQGYNYNTSTVILGGTPVIGSASTGVPTTNVSWYVSKILDIGADYSLLGGKLSGSLDYFYRKRTGLLASKYDVLVPSEIGYTLPSENLNSDAVMGGEAAIAYTGKIKKVNFSVGANFTYARSKNLNSYKPVFNNSLDHYANSTVNRWSGTFWGYECIGQFQSQQQINSYPVNIDGQGNKTLLPGDLIYKDQNGDGVINGYDARPIGWGTGRNPIMNLGLNITVGWKGFDVHVDFSGGSGYSFNRNYEMRWPYQNGGALQKIFYDDRWHRENPFDLNSQWIPGKYPALRFNDGGHSNYNANSTFWLINVHYLRCRTLELGYSLPKQWLDKVKLQKARFYINANNLFSLDNVHNLGIDAEIADDNGLTYPQSKYLNIGFDIAF